MSLKKKVLSVAMGAVVAIPGSIALAETASAAPADSGAATIRLATKTMYTNTSARVRSGPGTNYKILRTLPAGTKVNVVGGKNGWSQISGGGWIRNDLLTSKGGGAALNNTGSGGGGTRWIEYNVSNYCVYLHEGNSVVWQTCSTSNGKPSTPTITGEFRVYSRARGPICMHPPGDDEVCGINYVTYWGPGGYAFHEAWWMGNRVNRGISHGCVNMRKADAQTVYNFSTVGMRVWVHR